MSAHFKSAASTPFKSLNDLDFCTLNGAGKKEAIKTQKRDLFFISFWLQESNYGCLISSWIFNQNHKIFCCLLLEVPKAKQKGENLARLSKHIKHLQLYKPLGSPKICKTCGNDKSLEHVKEKVLNRQDMRTQKLMTFDTKIYRELKHEIILESHQVLALQEFQKLQNSKRL